MINFDQVDNWLAARDFARETQEKYRVYLARLDAWLRKENLDLMNLQPAIMREFLEAQNWGRRTQHNALYGVRSWIRGQGLDDHPLLSMRIRLPEPGPQRTLSIEDARELLAVCDAGGRPKDVRNAAMISLLMDTGLRADELCRLAVPPGHFKKRFVSVLGKGRRWRICVFSEATAERIMAWVPVRNRWARPEVPELFVSVGGLTPGRPLTRYGLTMIWRELAARAGIPALSSHDFRRGFAVASAQNRMPVQLLMWQGGWSKIDTMAGYLRSMTLDQAVPYLPMEQQVEA